MSCCHDSARGSTTGCAPRAPRRCCSKFRGPSTRSTSFQTDQADSCLSTTRNGFLRGLLRGYLLTASRDHATAGGLLFSVALGPHPQRELTLTSRLGFARPRLDVAAGAHF